MAREDRNRDPMDRSVDRAVYIISVAAELAGVHPQTLRFYERRGLLSPKRTSGNTRRYSERDIERLQMIQDLTQRRGVNLAGAKLIMEMQLELERLRRQTRELEEELDRARRAIPMGPGVERGAAVDIVPLRAVMTFPWLGRP
ncbi:MAG TPA: helix-turn-helix transcriptional regulator [Actinomycetota bacterium]|nr:helix-turn-helix transcriptional regulator [Actinomycetota bacterium]